MKKIIKIIGMMAMTLICCLPHGWIITSAKAAEPVAIKIIDCGGDLSSTQKIIENYKAANPDKVKSVSFLKAPAPEIPTKIKVQQDAKTVDINLILTGQDAASVLVERGQLIKLFPDYQKKFPVDQFTDIAKILRDEGEGYCMPSVVSHGGPLFIYNPSKVPNPPKTVDEFKTWVKANPGKFQYARPANSGPGRSIMMGSPYFLGDKNPKEPIKGWDKAWAFMKEIGQYIEYYPTGTTITMKEFAAGNRWIIAGIMEWELRPRAVGMIPIESKIFILPNTTFVIDGHYWCIPKGISEREKEVVLDMMAFLLTPKQQALTYEGFIGPVVKNTSVNLAPKDIQDLYKSVWRPEYSEILKKHPHAPALSAKLLVSAMDKWDQEVGAKKVK
jgi:putative spermidine/putrescine transport system substrate-binding protein